MKHNKICLILGSVALGLSVFAFVSAKQAKKENVVTFATYTNGDAATYYNGISTTASGNTLLTALRTLNLNKRKSTVGYSSMGTSPSGQFKYTDYDPNYVQYDSNGQPYGTRISSFYTYTSATSWNREHVWPNSHGGGNGGDAGSPYPDADIHMPRPTISSENSSRGNSFFVEGMNHSSNGWDPYTAGYNEQSRGEAARITFYCMLVNSNLNLAPNNTSPSGTDPVTNISYGSGHTMGNLETLIKWNINYPVTQREKNRNEGAEYLQGNRNAFVDHPEYACRIWGNVNSTIKNMCSSASWDTGTGVSLSRSTATVTVGQTITLSATSTDSSTITWTTSNASIASIASSTSNSGANMTITGVSTGSATITAKATINNTQYSDTCTVTVTDSSVQPDQGDYVLVTSNTQLSNGDKVVLSMDREREEVKGVTGWNGTNDATVSVNETDWCQYVVSNASTSGFKLKDTTANSYIASPTGNHYKYDSSGGTVSAASDGKFVCNSRYLCQNGTYYRCYTSVGSYIPFYIYKVNTGSSTTKTLSSISLSEVTTSFNIGEEFESPIVTASYSDGSTADVTSSATCSGYNMNVAGDYTVTVSYTEGGVTKTATYSIVVSSGVTPEPTGDYSLTSGSPYINGVAYRMYFTKSSTNYYFDGTIVNNYYGSTAGNPVDVYFEQNGNGQNIYFYNSANSGIKTFITLTNASYRNFTLNTSTPSTPWIYSSTEETLMINVSGTSYYTGADSSHDTFTGKNVIYKAQFVTSTSEGAIAFATIMNEYITCDNSGNSTPTFRTGFTWSSFASVYANLDSTSKTLLKSTNPSNTEVAEYVARYDYIVGKYGTSAYSDFIGRNPSPIGNHRLNTFVRETINNATAIIVIIASILAISTFAGYFIIRRKKQ